MTVIHLRIRLIFAALYDDGEVADFLTVQLGDDGIARAYIIAGELLHCFGGLDVTGQRRQSCKNHHRVTP